MEPFYNQPWSIFRDGSKSFYASSLAGHEGAALSALAAGLARSYDEGGQVDKAAEKYNDVLAFNQRFLSRGDIGNRPTGGTPPPYQSFSPMLVHMTTFRSTETYDPIIGDYTPVDEVMASYLAFATKHGGLCKQEVLDDIKAKLGEIRNEKALESEQKKLLAWGRAESNSIVLLKSKPDLALEQLKTEIQQRKIENVGSPSLSDSLTMIGYQLVQAGMYAAGEPFLKDAIALREKAGAPALAVLGNSCSNLGLLYLEEGRLAEAKPLLEKALKLRALDASDPFAEAKTKIVYGRLLAAQGQPALAEAQLKEAVQTLAGNISAPPKMTADDTNLLIRNPEQYMRNRAGASVVQSHAGLYYLMALNELGAIYIVESKFDPARQALQLALKKNTPWSELSLEPQIYEKLGRLATATGKFAEAKTSLAKAQSRAADIDAPKPIYVNIYCALGDLNKRIGKKKEASAYYAKAADLLQEMLGATNVRVIAVRKLANSRF
jgi:tetratricopeptide (TPR) repeat protein